MYLPLGPTQPYCAVTCIKSCPVQTTSGTRPRTGVHLQCGHSSLEKKVVLFVCLLARLFADGSMRQRMAAGVSMPIPMVRLQTRRLGLRFAGVLLS